MFNPNDLTDVAKVTRYFDLYQQTDGINGDNLSDEQHDVLSAERVKLWYETGLGEMDDDTIERLADEHLPPLS